MLLDFNDAINRYYLCVISPRVFQYVESACNEHDAVNYIADLAVVSLSWRVLNPSLMTFLPGHLFPLLFQHAQGDI